MKPPRLSFGAILALGILAGALPAHAASFAGYGFRTGVASTGIHGDLSEFYESGTHTGYSVTGFARIWLSRWFSIQPEVGWTSKGDEGALTFLPYGDIPVRTRLDYLQIPVLLQLHVPTGSGFEPFLIAGPGMAIRTGSSQEIDLAALPAGPGPAKVQFANIFENVGTFDNPNFRNVDWNVVGGGGLAYGRSSLRFVLDTRYELGLAGIYPDSKRSWAHNGAWITTLGVELKK